ncbi:MAG: hypothetical protein ACRC62_10905 [Microcoleus sp.]
MLAEEFFKYQQHFWLPGVNRDRVQYHPASKCSNTKHPPYARSHYIGSLPLHQLNP